jgi:hypothetical protein
MKKFLSPGIAMVFLLTACGNAGSDTKKDSIVTARKDSTIISTIDTTSARVEDSINNAAVFDPGKEVLLRFNLEKGRSYAYEIALGIAQEMQERKMNTGMNWKYTIQVINDKGSLKTLKVIYDRIGMSMDMGGQKMEFSSDSPAGDPSNPLNMVTNLFSAMKGKSFTMKVDANGQIKEVNGIDQLGEELVTGLNLPAASKDRMLQSFRSKFNENDVKETFSQTFSMLPNKKVKPGDSWERESMTRVGPTKGKLLTVYTVRSIKGNIVKLSGKGRLQSENGNVTGTQNSSLVIDADNGLVLENVFDMNTEGRQKLSTHGKITGKKL